MIAPGEHEYVGDGETCRAAGCGRPPWLGQHRKPTEDIEQSIVDSTCSQEPAAPAPVSPKCEGWQHMEASEQEGIDPETFCDAYEASECKRPCPAGQCATRPGPGDLTPQREPPAPDDAVREIAERWWRTGEGLGYEKMCLSAVSEAFAAGRVLGAKEEREACEKIARDTAQTLLAWMAKEPVGSAKRKELSLRSGERAAVAISIAARGAR